MKFSATVPLQYDTIFSPFSHQEYLKGLDWMKASGFDGAELCISHYNGIDLPRVHAELEERGLGCSTLSTGQARALEGLSLIGVAPEITHKTQKRLMEHIDAAKILGSKVTLGLIRGLGDPATMEQDLKSLSEAMKPLIEYADKQHVTLILEAINRYESALLNSAQADLEFIQTELGNPDCVGILWDLFHANIEDVDFQESVDLMGSKLQHIHLADSNRMFPGYGHIDFAKILQYAEQKGFAGYYSFECFNKPRLETVLKDSAGWLRAMRGLPV